MLSKRSLSYVVLPVQLLLQVSAKTVGTVEHLSLEIQMQPTLPEIPSSLGLLSGILKKEKKKKEELAFLSSDFAMYLCSHELSDPSIVLQTEVGKRALLNSCRCIRMADSC